MTSQLRRRSSDYYEIWQANDMPIITHRSLSKLEVEYQYGGRPFLETGSSFILDVD